MNGWMERWMGGWMDGLMDKWMDGCSIHLYNNYYVFISNQSLFVSVSQESGDYPLVMTGPQHKKFKVQYIIIYIYIYIYI